MEKINLIELLEDCPQGMELDCTMFDNVTFVRVDNNREQFPIEIAVGGIRSKYLTKEGCFHDTELLPESKCVIFPKGKTTWEGFIPPCQFKNGDVIYVKTELFKWVSIFKKDTENIIITYADYDLDRGIYSYGINDNAGFLCHNNEICEKRIATEEEKQKLFQAIKNNGYKWNAETKTLDKLVEPNFKVGDRIKKKGAYISGLITDIDEDNFYKVEYKSGGVSYVNAESQNNYELVPNKFDINTLKPFESRVLVRDKNTDKWKSNFWGFYDIDNAMNYPYECCGNSFAQCIPYEGNEHLLSTTNDCDEFYKTW